jgi:hypothetical protein
VYRATQSGASAPVTPHVRLAMEERGLAPAADAPRPVPEGASADLIVSVAELPELGDEYRGKRIHFWRSTVLSPGTPAEARRLVAELEQEANCLVEEYRRRLH